MMPLRVYLDEALTTKAKTIIGELEGDGSTNSFVTSDQPHEIRMFSSSNPKGTIITDYTITDNGDGTYTIQLPTAPLEGEIVVAFDNGKALFEDLYVIGNSEQEEERTMEQTIYLYADGVNVLNLKATARDLSSASGMSPLWIYLSLDDGSGNPQGYVQTTIDVGDIPAGTAIPLHLKVVVPYNTPMGNYRDIYLEFEGLLEEAE